MAKSHAVTPDRGTPPKGMRKLRPDISGLNLR